MSVFSRRRYLSKIVRTVGSPAVSVSHSSPKHAFESCGIRDRSCGEVGKVGACTVRIGCRVSRGQMFEESRRQDTSSRGAWPSRQAVGRVSAVPGSSRKAFGDGKLWSPLSPSRIGCKKSPTLGPRDWRSSPPHLRWRWTATLAESNTSKRWSPSSAERGTSCDQTEPRRSERRGWP